MTKMHNALMDTRIHTSGEASLERVLESGHTGRLQGTPFLPTLLILIFPLANVT